MRRAQAATIALLLVLSTLNASAAKATTPQVTLHAHFAPNKLNASTTVYFGVAISEPVPLRSMELRLPAGMGVTYSSLGLAECSTTTLYEYGPERCPPNSLLGRGSTIGQIPWHGSNINETAPVTILRGPLQNENMTILVFINGITPIWSVYIFTAQVLAAPPPYGEALRLEIPILNIWPEGPDVGLVRFHWSIGPHGLRYTRHEHGHRVTYEPRGLNVPAHCPLKGFPVAARFQWWNSSQPVVAATRVPCPKS